MSEPKSSWYRWDSSAQVYIDEENNRYSKDGHIWQDRMFNPAIERDKHSKAALLGTTPAIADSNPNTAPQLKSEHDAVRNPAHYKFSFETWDILDEVFPDKPLLWAATKYLFRAGRKGDYLEQLEKAYAFLAREIMKERKRRYAKK